MSCKNYEFAKPSKMSFKQKTNIDNIKFAELDRLINDWIFETGELYSKFMNQTAELNCIKKQGVIHDCKCEAINNSLNRMKCVHNYLDYVMRTCQEYQERFEEMVLLLECKILDLYREPIPRDKLRTKLYETAEKIDEALINNQRMNDKLTVGMIKKDRQYTKDPSELIARILMRQLYNLEMIEVKIQQMFNDACVVNCQMVQLKCEISAGLL